MIKDVASDLMARSYNYNKCAHHQEGVKLCRDAQQNPHKIGLSRYCPEPETSPNLICQLGKWAFSVHQQHEIEMVGISSFERFNNNKYNFTLSEFQEEIWKSYKRCGNNCSDTDWGSLPFGTSIVSEWKLPTCVNDGIQINDFFIDQGAVNNQNAWGFPSICGDYHANETEGFMNAMHIGINSTVYKGRETAILWSDRIPRVSLLCVGFFFANGQCRNLTDCLRTKIIWLFASMGFDFHATESIPTWKTLLSKA
jgi:hypothetical protein